MTISTRVLRYVAHHKDGVSGQQVTAWLKSCREGWTIWDIEKELKKLRNDGKISHSNGVWWLR